MKKTWTTKVNNKPFKIKVTVNDLMLNKITVDIRIPTVYDVALSLGYYETPDGWKRCPPGCMMPLEEKKLPCHKKPNCA